MFRAVRIARALADAGSTSTSSRAVRRLRTPTPAAPGSAACRRSAPRSDNLSRLVTPDGAEADEAYLEERRQILLDLFRDIRPDVLITEAFPFGRRQMRFELLPLLEAARQTRPAPKIIASVRDILQENRKPGRDLETVGYAGNLL